MRGFRGESSRGRMRMEKSQAEDKYTNPTWMFHLLLRTFKAPETRGWLCNIPAVMHIIFTDNPNLGKLEDATFLCTDAKPLCLNYCSHHTKLFCYVAYTFFTNKGEGEG